MSGRAGTGGAGRTRDPEPGIAAAIGSDMPNAQWEFVVFESKELNAFALPGGKVGVYTGLLQLAESDAELAIVMGHEIGHVIARHGSKRMTEGLATAEQIDQAIEDEVQDAVRFAEESPFPAPETALDYTYA